MFRQEECFPHPNPNVENNRTYQPVLFEFFPQAKIEIKRWANNHLDLSSCNNVVLEIREKVLPKLFQSYLDSMYLKPEDLLLEEFLSDYGLKNVCNTTIWRWIKINGYEYSEKKETYYSGRHEHKENVEYRKI